MRPMVIQIDVHYSNASYASVHMQIIRLDVKMTGWNAAPAENKWSE